MGDKRVLVVYANQAGSTAGIANVIAARLRRAGFAVDRQVAGEVADVTPYAGVVIGSGVFVTSRHSDGGGFLARHEATLAERPVWLFSAGPIGRGRCPSGTAADATAECSVVVVARAVGARGAAVFGPIGLPEDSDPIERLGPVDHDRVRAWASEIAMDLAADTGAATGRKAGDRARASSRMQRRRHCDCGGFATAR
jgi:menaquinone-dependent protoporphyrinogen oxidase